MLNQNQNGPGGSAFGEIKLKFELNKKAQELGDNRKKSSFFVIITKYRPQNGVIKVLTRRDLFLGRTPSKTFSESESGATVAEYAMIAGVFGLVGLAMFSRIKKRKKNAA
ncbi:MAG: hypothetical protein AAGJ68_07820 [Pseudomonadota bacterium]